VIRITNRLRLEGEPVLFDRITIGAEHFPGLTRTIFVNRPGTIYHLYQERYGISVIRAAERLRAVSADAAAAKALGVRTGSPLLEIERIAYTYRDRPVELRVSHVNTERHAYLSELGKK
jgi:GntR family transcriptional regulator